MKYKVMNAYLADDHSVLKNPDNKYIFEPKLDGFRSLCHINKTGYKLLSRNKDIDLTHRWDLKDFRKSIKADTAILDGEIVAFDAKGLPNFNLLKKGTPATYIVFDILMLNGKSLMDLPLMERKKILQRVVKSSASIKKTKYSTNGTQMWKKVKQTGLEGLMAKEKDAIYYPGYRKHVWLKVKQLFSVDFVIVGYTSNEPSGSTLSSLCVGLYNSKKQLVYMGKCGTGFTEKERIDMHKKLNSLRIAKVPVINEAPAGIYWVKPVLVCEVAFLELLNRGSANYLRHPSLLRMRTDKKPVQCTIADQIPHSIHLEVNS